MNSSGEKVKTIAVGKIVIGWKCYFCGKENTAELHEEGKKVKCKWCVNESELWVEKEYYVSVPDHEG